MPYVEAEPLALPFSGSVSISRHCSYDGARSAQERCGRQALALLAAYRRCGPLTDADAATELGIQRSTINARRGELVKLGLVQAMDTVKNAETGVRNTRWGLTAG